MNAHDTRENFLRFLTDEGLTLEKLPLTAGVSSFLSFYRNNRAEDCSVDSEGDMLLYQWGMTQEDTGHLFEVNFTRQFMIEDQAEDEEADEEGIWHLSLSFLFEGTESLSAIVPGNKWCSQPRPRAVDYFEKFIRASEAFKAVSHLQTLRVELNDFNAG